MPEAPVARQHHLPHAHCHGDSSRQTGHHGSSSHSGRWSPTQLGAGHGTTSPHLRQDPRPLSPLSRGRRHQGLAAFPALSGTVSGPLTSGKKSSIKAQNRHLGKAIWEICLLLYMPYVGGNSFLQSCQRVIKSTHRGEHVYIATRGAIVKGSS